MQHSIKHGFKFKLTSVDSSAVWEHGEWFASININNRSRVSAKIALNKGRLGKSNIRFSARDIQQDLGEFCHLRYRENLRLGKIILSNYLSSTAVNIGNGDIVRVNSLEMSLKSLITPSSISKVWLVKQRFAKVSAQACPNSECLKLCVLRLLFPVGRRVRRKLRIVLIGSGDSICRLLVDLASRHSL